MGLETVGSVSVITKPLLFFMLMHSGRDKTIVDGLCETERSFKGGNVSNAYFKDNFQNSVVLVGVLSKLVEHSHF